MMTEQDAIELMKIYVQFGRGIYHDELRRYMNTDEFYDIEHWVKMDALGEIERLALIKKGREVKQAIIESGAEGGPMKYYAYKVIEDMR